MENGTMAIVWDKNNTTDTWSLTTQKLPVVFIMIDIHIQ